VIKSGLGPHVVGQRVVVRRLVPGETGPTGGPALTDLLGICESWNDASMTVRAEDGSLTEIALSDVVSGKPVPPRPSRFRRLSDAEVDARCDALRAAPPAADPIGVHLVGVASLSRALANPASAAGVESPIGPEVEVTEPTSGALGVEVRLEGTLFASAAVRYDDNWALLTELVVEPDQRRRGVRRLLLSTLTDVLAERGLSVLAGEIPVGDIAGTTLAAMLGFELHHTRC
jgi:GNAT superfamily N-acetyltransferase